VLAVLRRARPRWCNHLGGNAMETGGTASASTGSPHPLVLGFGRFKSHQNLKLLYSRACTANPKVWAGLSGWIFCAAGALRGGAPVASAGGCCADPPNALGSLAPRQHSPIYEAHWVPWMGVWSTLAVRTIRATSSDRNSGGSGRCGPGFGLCPFHSRWERWAKFQGGGTTFFDTRNICPPLKVCGPLVLAYKGNNRFCRLGLFS